MERTPREGVLPSLLFSSSPARGADARQPSWAGGPVSTPFTPGSTRFLQPIQAPRSDGPHARFGKRVLTPSEPPPPPGASLLDADLTAPFAHEPRHANDTAVPSAWHGVDVPASSAAPLQSRDVAQHGATSVDHLDTWVTVFGFAPQQSEQVLREFQKCGEVVTSGSFAAEPVNWVHVQYSHADEAQRALLRDGYQLTSTLIVGVKKLDPRQRATVSEQVENRLPVELATRPPPHAERPYLLARPTTGTLNVIEPRESIWAKVSRYVIGL